MSQWVKIESALVKWVFKPRPFKHPVTKLAMLMYGDYVRSIRAGLCPFCGRRFRKIVSHLNGRVSSRLVLGNWRLGYASFSVYTNPCYVSFQQVIEDIVNTYVEFRNDVTWNGHAYVVDGSRFPNLEKALIYWFKKRFS